MLRDDRRAVIEIEIEIEVEIEIEAFRTALQAWRALPEAVQRERLGAARPAGIDPAVRDRVLACTERGPVLPLSLQDDCGCRGKELSECRAGRGTIAGRVTLSDCLRCMGG